jgi:hypothetical protein
MSLPYSFSNHFCGNLFLLLFEIKFLTLILTNSDKAYGGLSDFSKINTVFKRYFLSLILTKHTVMG